MIAHSIIPKSKLEGAQRIDAEYYKPKYLKLLNIIKASSDYKSLRETGCEVVSGPFGSSLKSESYLLKGIPFIRISNLDKFFIDTNDLVYISEANNERLKQSQLRTQDLVLSKVGNTIGIVSSIPKEFEVCNISENNIGIKFSKDHSDGFKKYLLVFLNSRFGRQQILRSISGNAQPKLNIKDIYSVVVPIPGSGFLLELGEIVEKMKLLTEKDKNFYLEAENLLLEELGLADFEMRDELVYVVGYAEVKEAERVDADYFQPKYIRLIEKLEKHNTVRLGEIVDIKKGIEPGSKNYQEEGKPFIRVSNISKEGFTDKDQKYLDKTLYEQLEKKYKPLVNEILLTKDATPGIAYVIKESIEGIIASGMLRLQLKSEVEPEYLALCLNSIVGQLQVERTTFGSVIAHWRLDQVKKTEIPLLSPKIQRKLSELVEKSHAARKKSKDLLEEAKKKVEEMIEKKARKRSLRMILL